MLIVGAILTVAASLAFASTRNLFFLIIAGAIGVISPSGNEVGPFLSMGAGRARARCSQSIAVRRARFKRLSLRNIRAAEAARV
jgi:hypothetical protein